MEIRPLSLVILVLVATVGGGVALLLVFYLQSDSSRELSYLRSMERRSMKNETATVGLKERDKTIVTTGLREEVEHLKRRVDELMQMLENQTKGPFPSSLAIESAKIDALVTGSVAVSVPVTANKGEPFKALLRIQRSGLPSLLDSLKKEMPNHTKQMGKANVKLTPRMTATLVGHGFDIQPKEGFAQAVSDADETTWEWTVTPMQSGLLSLQFTLSGTLRVEGTDVPRQFYAYTQNVDVSIGILGFVQEYWQWLVTTLAIPAIAALWALYRRPKDATGMRQPSIVEKLRSRRHAL